MFVIMLSFIATFTAKDCTKGSVDQLTHHQV